MVAVVKVGLALNEAEVSQAVDMICVAEGIARSSVISVDVMDRDISVRYARSNDCNRTFTYPLVAHPPRGLEPRSADVRRDPVAPDRAGD